MREQARNSHPQDGGRLPQQPRCVAYLPLGVEPLLPDDEPEVPEVPELPEAPDESGVLDAPALPELPAVPEEPDEVSAAPDEPEVPDAPDVPAAPAPGEVAPLLPELSAGFSFAAFGVCLRTCLRLCFGFLVSMPLSELLVPVVAWSPDDCWRDCRSLACCSISEILAGSVLS